MSQTVGGGGWSKFEFSCSYDFLTELWRFLRFPGIVTIWLIAEAVGGHLDSGSFQWYLVAYSVSILATVIWYFIVRRSQPIGVVVRGDEVVLVFTRGRSRRFQAGKVDLVEPDRGYVRLRVDGHEYILGRDLSNLGLLKERLNCPPQKPNPPDLSDDEGP